MFLIQAFLRDFDLIRITIMNISLTGRSINVQGNSRVIKKEKNGGNLGSVNIYMYVFTGKIFAYDAA